ncbi:serine threonine-protein kinase [Nesidiocoris tenuis]|uniref:non-specific serine/threonine protein kinase n=1 Tax=Nesidiocoris tenuis TaxID=355587 RepID=A0ABN7AAB3_9HEMI|nr:serine threonine-protein kinase [Nesidiocoris tenuis]
MIIPRRKASVTNFKCPDLKNAEIICDVTGKRWRLGKSIGVGAFGQIYLASDEVLKPVSPNTNFIIKMEPHSSGPLFVERNFYLRFAKYENIEKWMSEKRLKCLGVPHIYSFGSCIHEGERVRFIVIPKFGFSIQTMLAKYNNKFHIKTAFTIGLHVVDALQFVHEQGYIHADIKAANMVLGSDSPTSAPVYLIDYGLVSRYRNKNGSHEEFRQDPRVANAGTAAFSSRDSHKGVICRRSDLESLGYCLVSWLGGTLPWEDSLASLPLVEQQKDDAMADIRGFLARAFSSRPPSSVLYDYFAYVVSMDFDSKPNYKYIKELLQSGIIRAGFRCDRKVTFDSHAKLDRKSLKRIAERENVAPPFKKKKLTADSSKSSEEENELNNRVTRNLDRNGNGEFENFNWAKILAGDPEKILRQACTREKRSRSVQKSSAHIHSKKNKLTNPTPAMLMVVQRRSVVDNQRRSSRGNDSYPNQTLTYAMEEVIAARQPPKRVLRSASRRPPKP